MSPRDLRRMSWLGEQGRPGSVSYTHLDVYKRQPYMQRSYPVPFSKRRAVQEELDRMMQGDIIERSVSPLSLIHILKIPRRATSCKRTKDMETEVDMQEKEAEHHGIYGRTEQAFDRNIKTDGK